MWNTAEYRLLPASMSAVTCMTYNSFNGQLVPFERVSNRALPPVRVDVVSLA